MATLPRAFASPSGQTTYKKPSTTKKTTVKKATVPTVPRVSTAATTVSANTAADNREAQAKKDFEARQKKKAELKANEEKVVLADSMPQLQQQQKQQVQPVVRDPYADILAEIERQRKASARLAEQQRQAQIAQGQLGLQGALGNTQAELARQASTVDPRYSGLKSSAVAGTRVAQKRLTDLLPFSGVMAGTQARQAQDIETGLQQRQSELDTTRATEEADIAYRGQQAQREYDLGLQQVQAGANADKFANLISSNQQADKNVLSQLALADERAYNEQLAEATRLRNQTAYQEDLTRQASSDTLNLAMQKWNMGIALNEAEAAALGVPTGSTKPKATSGGGGSSSGLSASSEASLAKWKIENNIPLSSSEAALVGVNTGYTAPEAVDYLSSNDIRSGIESMKPGSTLLGQAKNVFSNIVGDRPEENKDYIYQYIANNIDAISEEEGAKLIQEYGLDPYVLQQMIN